MLKDRILGRALVGHLRAAAAALLALSLGACATTGKSPGAKAAAPAPQKAEPAKPEAADAWISLFDGKDLGDWQVATKDDFQMHGPVEVKDGDLVLKTGMPFTGIVRPGDFPKQNFEIELDAMRKNGTDIFMGLTFPVGDSHCTMVMGGWGDSVVGLSSIDDQNASENPYVRVRGFDNNKWYRIRLRVTPAKIEGWIDATQVLDVPRAKHKFTIYPELEPIRPLGFFSWETDGALRNIRYRVLKSQ